MSNQAGGASLATPLDRSNSTKGSTGKFRQARVKGGGSNRSTLSSFKPAGYNTASETRRTADAMKKRGMPLPSQSSVHKTANKWAKRKRK
jgi:hypothetical protein